MSVAPGQPRPGWSDRTTGLLAWLAVAWTVAAGVALALAPMVSVATSSSVSTPEGSPGAVPEVVTTRSTETLLQNEGAGLVVVLLVPVAVALVGALGGGPAARRRRIAAGGVLLGACVVGAMSIGIFYLPAAVALLTAGLATRVERAATRPPRPGGGAGTRAPPRCR
jgi:hypothetical protein